MAHCLHCNTQFSPTAEEGFCCTGCEYVYRLLHENELGRFYELQGDALGAPLQDRPFESLDYEWLQKMADDAEAKAGAGELAKLDLSVGGITCIGCVWLIEKLYLQREGNGGIDIHPDSGKVTLHWQKGVLDLPEFAKEIHRFGYLLSPADTHPAPPSLATRLAICGGLALNTMAFALPRYFRMEESFELAPLMDLIAMGSATLAVLIGGSHFFVRAWQALRLKTLHLDFPISLGLLAAWLGSIYGWAVGRTDLLYFDFVANFTFLMLGGRYLQQLATTRARNQSRRQSPLPPYYRTPGAGEIVTTQIEEGDELLIPVDSPIPVASLLLSPQVSCSLAWINGEPDPVIYRQGQRLPTGAINLNSEPIHVCSEEAWSESLTARLTAPSDTPDRSPLLARLIRIYLIAVLAITFLAALYWFRNAPPATALQVVISILVVSCPCALGTAIPLLGQRAALSLQSFGVFIQSPSVWEKLPHIKRLILDKTGTLTLQHPSLQNPEAFDALSEREKSVLFHLTASSLHPLSRSLFQQLSIKSITKDSFSSPVLDTPGVGLSTEIDGKKYELGRVKPDGGELVMTTDAPQSDFLCNGEILASFHFQEELRPRTREVLERLSRFETYILSGDHDASVQNIARQLQLPAGNAHGNLSPDDKAHLTEKLDTERPSLYLGDGANDALAFHVATLTATPVTDRSLLDRRADILFTSTGLEFLPRLFSVAHWHRRLARHIFFFAIAYNSVAISLCLLGYMSPLVAAIIMPISSFITLLIASQRVSR